jgi:hypothetical protein
MHHLIFVAPSTKNILPCLVKTNYRLWYFLELPFLCKDSVLLSYSYDRDICRFAKVRRSILDSKHLYMPYGTPPVGHLCRLLGPHRLLWNINVDVIRCGNVYGRQRNVTPTTSPNHQFTWKTKTIETMMIERQTKHRTRWMRCNPSRFQQNQRMVRKSKADVSSSTHDLSWNGSRGSDNHEHTGHYNWHSRPCAAHWTG